MWPWILGIILGVIILAVTKKKKAKEEAENSNPSAPPPAPTVGTSRPVSAAPARPAPIGTTPARSVPARGTPVSGAPAKVPIVDEPSVGRLKVGATYATPAKPVAKSAPYDASKHSIDRILSFEPKSGVWVCKKCEAYNSQVNSRCNICSQMK